MKIAFIGGGNMGEAMLSAVLGKGVSQPSAIAISDVSDTRRQYLQEKYNMAAMNDNRQAIDSKDVVVLAIKPQNLAAVMDELNGQPAPEQLVLSIVTGARIDTIRHGMGCNRIVRAMPNTPAQIGEGIAVWTATAEVSSPQKEWARAILGAMGRQVYADDEKYLDMATAVSGSGPAYVFLFMEALVAAAIRIGLPQDVAQELVLETVLGSGHFAQKSDKTLAELRRMVTSPGGTTAEALLQFENGKFADLVERAVTAAYNKAKRLGS